MTKDKKIRYLVQDKDDRTHASGTVFGDSNGYTFVDGLTKGLEEKHPELSPFSFVILFRGE